MGGASFQVYAEEIKYPEIFIEIGAPGFDKLNAQRKELLENRTMSIFPKGFVRATIKTAGKNIKVSIGLKKKSPGKLADPEKWPLDIKIDNGQTLWGRSQFSMQNPADNGFLKIFLFNETIKSEELLGLDFRFAKVTVNGNNWGILAVESRPDQNSSVEHQGAKGIIIDSFDALSPLKMNPQEPSHYRQGQLYEEAIRILRKVGSGEVEFSKKFDLDKWAKLHVFKTMFGIDHRRSGTPFFKIYYNPRSRLFEPVGYASQSFMDLISPRGAGYHFLRRAPSAVGGKLPTYPKDYKPDMAYVTELERISRKTNIEKITSKFSKILSRADGLQRLPEADSVKTALIANAESSRLRMSPVKFLSAYFREIDGRSLILTIRNINNNFPLLIESVSLKNSTVFKSKTKAVLPVAAEWTGSDGKPAEFNDYRFDMPKDFSWSHDFRNNLTVNFRVLGHPKLNEDRVHPEPLFNDRIFNERNVTRIPNFKKFNFLKINEDQKEIVIVGGKWVLDRTLVVPAGYRVIAEAGTELDLVNKAMVISYSPLNLRGSADSPILIHSSDSSGLGLAIINSPSPSTLHFVNFKSLASPNLSAWALTGAVTFYESELFISYCTFIDNRAEDALNIIRSKFYVNNTRFEGNKADALDSDFSKGELSKIKFIKNGNDAIDISGGQAVINDIVVNGSGDKGLSVGEKSRVTADGLLFSSVPIGVASKDLSEVNLDNVKITHSTIGLAAYQKKPEYGPAKLVANNAVLDGVVLPYFSEKKSLVKINREVMAESRIKTKTLLLKLGRWARSTLKK